MRLARRLAFPCAARSLRRTLLQCRSIRDPDKGCMKREHTSRNVAIAAEAIAAARFARLGFDVSVQYGANQPEYDLMIDNGEKTLKISVKGSQDGSWGLSQSQLAKLGHANYHGAADAWLARHKQRTVLCLV